MVKKMKLRFLNKHTSSSSHSSHSSSSSSSWPWPWPSSHPQNRETISSKACFYVSKPKRIDEPSPDKFSSCSSFSSSSHAMDNPLEPEVIENVIKGLKPSKRLIFEQRGESNSILENAIKTEIEEEEDEEAHKEEEEEEGGQEEEEEEEGFMLLALESKDPYTDFRKSMEKMVETHELHHDWRSLEKLLFWFLKVNVKTSHKYIFTAFVDLLLSLPVELSKNLLEDSPSSPISFITSCSYSDETSSMLPGNSICEIKRSVGCCLSSLFEMDVKINDNLEYVSSY